MSGLKLVYDPNELLQKLELKTGFGGGLKGDELVALCPFPHYSPERGKYFQSRTPSFGINIRTGAFHCFACQRKGKDIKALLKGLKKEHIVLLKKSGFTLPESEKVDKFEVHPEMLESFSARRDVAKAYLKSRNMNPDVADVFQMGSSHNGKTIFIPLFNLEGKFVGWSERHNDDGPIRWEHKPYGIERNEILFGKGKTLKKADKKGSRLFLTESQTDVIKLVGWGYEAGATLGASASEAVLRHIADNYKTVVIFPHADGAGAKWASQVSSYLVERNVIVSVAFASDMGYGDVGDIPEKQIFDALLEKRVLIKLSKKRYDELFNPKKIWRKSS